MPIQPPPPVPRKASIDVRFLIESLRDRIHLDVTICAGEKICGERLVTEANLHRPGLALAGYVSLFTHHRVQILGNTEIEYIRGLSDEDRRSAFEKLFSFNIPLVMVTNGNRLPEDVERMAEAASIPVVYTKAETTRVLSVVQDFLEDQFAPQTMVHGTMMDIYGIGILIAGKSGIGKSEVGLDLVERGHRLVADDAVMLSRKGSVLMASATEISKHFMEIRGLGILDVMSMFGIRAIRYQKRLEVVLELSFWSDRMEVERTGLNSSTISIMDTEIPLIQLPITPGKNITVIAETIAINHLLKHYGYDAARVFQEKVKRQILDKRNGNSSPASAIDYFEGDIE